MQHCCMTLLPLPLLTLAYDSMHGNGNAPTLLPAQQRLPVQQGVVQCLAGNSLSSAQSIEPSHVPQKLSGQSI